MTITRAQANEILTLWKNGAAHYPQATIMMCLYLTGDLE